MNPQEYQAFTDALQRNLEPDLRVLGLMAAGSMAGCSHQPDEWSDHDFWMIVESDAVDWFAANTEWLPDNDHIVLFFRDAVHDGFTTIYESGHILEFAVSDHRGLLHAKINDHRLLIDRAGLAADLARMHNATNVEYNQILMDDRRLFGQFISNILIGIGRYRRGEKISSRQLITVSSLHALLRLMAEK